MNSTQDKITEDKKVTTAELLNLYLTEWIHRDDIMWAQVFRFYVATLSLIVLPYTSLLSRSFTIELQSTWLFGFGIIMSLCFLIVSLAYGLRLKAIGETYNDAINNVECNIKRKPITEESKKSEEFQVKHILLKHIFNKPLSILIPWILFISLIALDFFVYFVIG